MTPRAPAVRSKSFSSDPAVLEDFYIWLEEVLHVFPLDKKDSERVVMATAEAFANAIQHGNQAITRLELARLGEGLGDERFVRTSRGQQASLPEEQAIES